MIDADFSTPSEWAHEYRLHGIQVVPCANKIPAIPRWKHLQNDLMPETEFEALYGPRGQYVQSYSMGMITGSASSRILMIDLDVYKPGGHAALQWWQRVLALHNNAMDLETWEQTTGGGGRQMFFRYPQSWRGAVNAKTDIFIDIRGQGGFAVLPPTTHASGRQYEWVAGRAPWEIVLLDAPPWLLEEMERLVREHGGGQNGPFKHLPSSGLLEQTVTSGPNGPFQIREQTVDWAGHLTDGRETKMRDLIWGAMLDWHRECPIKPGEDESRIKCAEKYLLYEDLITTRIDDVSYSKRDRLEAEGRGTTAFHVKWQYAMALWDTRVREEANKEPPSNESKKINMAAPEPEIIQARAEAKAKITGNLLEYLDVRQIKTQPDPVWMIDGIINEQALGFIFGPPGSLKTFIAMDIALSTAGRLASWWGRKINSPGAVIYLCREGVASLKFRIMAWEQHRQAVADDVPFYLIRKNLNFMNPADVGILLATVDEIASKAGVPIAAVFVDTVSRVLPGAKENQQEDMSLFVGACDALQQRFRCVVIGVHHTNKNGGIRGSTVIPGAGDFLIETRREAGAMAGSVVLQKIKDGEDGQELLFKVFKVELFGEVLPRSSLMVDQVEEAAKPKPGEGLDWPDIAICREILAAIDEQWKAGLPWCYATNSSRYAVINIINRWRLKRDVVKDILAKWTANKIIVEDVYSTKLRVKGYRKLVGF